MDAESIPECRRVHTSTCAIADTRLDVESRQGVSGLVKKVALRELLQGTPKKSLSWVAVASVARCDAAKLCGPVRAACAMHGDPGGAVSGGLVRSLDSGTECYRPRRTAGQRRPSSLFVEDPCWRRRRPWPAHPHGSRPGSTAYAVILSTPAPVLVVPAIASESAGPKPRQPSENFRYGSGKLRIEQAADPRVSTARLVTTLARSIRCAWRSSCGEGGWRWL